MRDSNRCQKKVGLPLQAVERVNKLELCRQISWFRLTLSWHPPAATRRSDMAMFSSTFMGSLWTQQDLLPLTAPAFVPRREADAFADPFFPPHSPSTKCVKASELHRSQIETDFIPAEIKAAAQWWSIWLSTPPTLMPIEAHEQRQKLEIWLSHALLERCNGHWYPSNPTRGSG